MTNDINVNPNKRDRAAPNLTFDDPKGTSAKSLNAKIRAKNKELEY